MFEASASISTVSSLVKMGSYTAEKQYAKAVIEGLSYGAGKISNNLINKIPNVNGITNTLAKTIGDTTIDAAKESFNEPKE